MTFASVLRAPGAAGGNSHLAGDFFFVVVGRGGAVVDAAEAGRGSGGAEHGGHQRLSSMPVSSGQGCGDWLLRTLSRVVSFGRLAGRVCDGPKRIRNRVAGHPNITCETSDANTRGGAAQRRLGAFLAAHLQGPIPNFASGMTSTFFAREYVLSPGYKTHSRSRLRSARAIRIVPGEDGGAGVAQMGAKAGSGPDRPLDLLGVGIVWPKETTTRFRSPPR